MTYHIDTYSFIDGQWMLQHSFDSGLGLTTGIYLLKLDNGHLYVSANNALLGSITTISSYNPVDGGWVLDSAFGIDPIEANTADNTMTDFDVSGDHLIAGMATYTLSMTRKSPAVHYKKTNGEWTYQETFYSSQADHLHDDCFGMQVQFTGDMLILSAFGDSSINPYQGKVYYTDESSLLGVVKENVQQIAVYPNPTHGNLYFETDAATENIELFSMTGHLLHTARNAKTISLDGLPAGIYLLKLGTATESQTFKIIKN